MKLLTNEKIDIKKWHDGIKQSGFSSPFQTPEFYNFFNSIDGLSADVFAVEENNTYSALVVVTVQKEKGPQGFFSRRGIIYGGPLVKQNQSFALTNLLREISTYYRNKLIYLEIRNYFDFSAYKDIFENNNFKYNRHLNVQLSIGNRSVKDILTKMKYNRRREINISYKEGTSVKSASTIEEVNQLYKILESLYRARVKLPLPDFSYFENLYKSEIGKVFIVKHEEKIIGGAFCLYYEDLSIYTLYYAGIRDYHKKIFPTHLAIMGVIEFAVNKNLKYIDFMGAGKPDEDYGVRDFKLQFGGDLVEHGRYILILNPALYKIGVLGLKMLAKIQ